MRVNHLYYFRDFLQGFPRSSERSGLFAARGLSPATKPHQGPDARERRVRISRGPLAPLRLIITSVFLKNQQPHSADSCSRSPRRSPSVIGCALLFPCRGGDFRGGNVGAMECQRVRGTPSPPHPRRGCCHDSGRTDTSSCALLPPASLRIPLPELGGSLWVGSLLGGLPRLPSDPRPHLVQGLIRAWATFRPRSAVLSFPMTGPPVI